MRQQLFISYARENKPDVEALTRDLHALGHQPWVDSDLRGGQTWWDEILRRIADSDVFITIVSPQMLRSVACKREFDWAVKLNKPVLPLAVGPLPDALPRAFSTRQIIDYSASARESAFALAAALGNLPPAPPPPNPLPEPPPPPLSYLSDLVDQIAQPGPLTHEQQRQVLTQLEPALRSADAEELRGGRYVLEMFGKRDDLYADVDRSLAQLGIPGPQPDRGRSAERPHIDDARRTAEKDALSGSSPPTAKNPARIALLIGVAAVVVAALVFVGFRLIDRHRPSAPPQAAAQGTIAGTCDEGGSCGVKQRTAPYTDAPRLYPDSLKDGTTVPVVCQTNGDVVTNAGHGTSKDWYRLSNGAYINSMYVNVKASGMIPAC
jgi:hypothetical protein